jgi:hypothetical protein
MTGGEPRGDSGARDKAPLEDLKPLETRPRGQFEKDGVFGDGPSHDSNIAGWLILIATIVGMVLVMFFNGTRWSQLR